MNNLIFSKSKSNALSNPNLLQCLKDHQVSEVYVMGLLAEGCVKATVVGLRKEKFNAIVVEDALGSKNAKQKTRVLNYLHKNNIRTVKTKQI